MAEDVKLSEGMSRFISEISTYGVVPDNPVTEVMLKRGYRIYSMRQRDPEDQEKEVVVRYKTRGSCRKCYGRGFVGIMLSNDPELLGEPIIEFCNCLRQVREEKASDSMEDEVLKAQAALPVTKASADFREVAPSGAMASTTEDIIDENQIGTLDA